MYQSCSLRARKDKNYQSIRPPDTSGYSHRRTKRQTAHSAETMLSQLPQNYGPKRIQNNRLPAYGYPLEEASLLAVTEAISWITEGTNKQAVDLVLFCAHTSQDYATYHRTLTALHNSYLARELSRTLRPSRQLKQLGPEQPATQRHTLEQQERASKRSRSGERLHNQQSNRPAVLTAPMDA